MVRPAVRTRVLGIAGWSGAGKTTLLVRLIPALVARGLRIATIKHAHHAFDVDVPGKDSWEHRRAGASEVIVASARRWVQMHELRDEAEPRLDQLLLKVSPCDLVLVEGFKRDPLPKLEVWRAAVGKPALHPQDASIVAVASDTPEVVDHARRVDLADLDSLVELVLDAALPLDQVLARLRAAADQSAAKTSSMDFTTPGSSVE